MKKLSNSEIQDSVKLLKGWRVEDGMLKKEFEFKDFKKAMAFMNRLATVAEKLNHHPDWSNSYNRVSISLLSHDVKGLTKNDFLFAEAADKTA